MVKKEHGKIVRFFSDTMLVCACFLFALSIFEPFMLSNYVLSRWYQSPTITSVHVTCWSYRATVVPNTQMRLLFNDYWFNQNKNVPIVFLDMPWLLIALFLTQVLTIILGLLSFVSRRETRAIPFILSIIAFVLMIQTSAEANMFRSSFVQYDLGYWLVYPSMFMFYFALITSLVR
jgi:hypothetical protein